MFSTVPGDMGGGGGPALPAADVTPQSEPEVAQPSKSGEAAALLPTNDKSDPGKGGAPAQATDQSAATSTEPPAPAASVPPPTPAGPSPEVQALKGQVQQLTNLLGTLMNQQTTPAAPAAPVRDFAQEKAVLDDALKAEKIDIATYSTKVGQLAMEQATAEAKAASSAGNATTIQQVQAELKKASDAAAWKAMCEANPGLADFAQTPEFAAIKAQNPLHDPLSAYLSNQLVEAKAATEKAVKEAVAAKEKEMVENIKAKGNAAVLGNPGGQKPAGVDFAAMLKEPDKYGGLAAVQAAKLKALRADA